MVIAVVDRQLHDTSRWYILCVLAQPSQTLFIPQHSTTDKGWVTQRQLCSTRTLDKALPPPEERQAGIPANTKGNTAENRKEEIHNNTSKEKKTNIF